MIDTAPFRVPHGRRVSLDDIPSKVDGGLKRKEAEEAFDENRRRLRSLQELLYAGNKHALLLVFQAMDAGGKDSTIRNVIGPLNPAGVRVTSFKAPNERELKYDFLWRVHQAAPRRGYIRVFNRSHYEDVLIARVKKLVPEDCWRKRYDHINAFESLLHDEGTTIVKFYLHISKQYQKKRLQRRLDRPDKHWKFNPADLEERKRWNDYREAFEEVFAQCNPTHAPWYIIPCEKRWFRNLLVSQVVLETLEGLNMQLPEVTFDPSKIEIPD